ncbi:13008_t:CDS:2 [Gigaspora rosea]|nr:13008_t:CDS:2 [Gigaspora rosea]
MSIGVGVGRLFGVGFSRASPHDAQCIVWGATSVIMLVYIDFFFVGHVSYVGKNVLVDSPELSIEMIWGMEGGTFKELRFRKAICRSLIFACMYFCLSTCRLVIIEGLVDSGSSVDRKCKGIWYNKEVIYTDGSRNFVCYLGKPLWCSFSGYLLNCMVHLLPGEEGCMGVVIVPAWDNGIEKTGSDMMIEILVVALF